MIKNAKQKEDRKKTRWVPSAFIVCSNYGIITFTSLGLLAKMQASIDFFNASCSSSKLQQDVARVEADSNCLFLPNVTLQSQKVTCSSAVWNVGSIGFIWSWVWQQWICREIAVRTKMKWIARSVWITPCFRKRCAPPRLSQICSWNAGTWLPPIWDVVRWKCQKVLQRICA